MKIICIGFLIGVAIGFIILTMKRKKAGNIDDQVSSLKHHWYDYPQGSKERETILSDLLLTLGTMYHITGLCRTEKEALYEVMEYIRVTGEIHD